jgi:uncharacterized protein
MKLFVKCDYMFKKLSILLLLIILAVITLGTVSAAANNTIQYSNVNNSKNIVSNADSLVLTAVDPKKGSINVDINKTINIKFNQPIKFKTAWIEFRKDGKLTSFEKSINSETLTIKPKTQMRKGSIYSIVLHTNSITNNNDTGVAYFSTSFSTAINIDIINHAIGGDITKNTLLYGYIQKTVLSNDIISKAKIGTPIIKFGDGNGPRVLIVAGVHGNELPAPAAAMKLINYLNGKHVHGTVYIIPFTIPYSIAHNTRYWHTQDPNRIANIAGSPTNLIVTLAKKLRVTALGDFHSSIPGGVPGKDSALCTMMPMYSSYKIARYIAKYSASSLIADKIAGKAYPGALEDVTNLNRIPAVTCEVLAKHNTLNMNRINKSYRQMWGLLKYLGID